MATISARLCPLKSTKPNVVSTGSVYRRPGLQLADQPGLGNAERLLLHRLVDRCTVVLTDLHVQGISKAQQFEFMV